MFTSLWNVNNKLNLNTDFTQVQYLTWGHNFNLLLHFLAAKADGMQTQQYALLADSLFRIEVLSTYSLWTEMTRESQVA